MTSRRSSITYCGSVRLPTAFAIVNLRLVRGLREAGYSVRQVDSLDEARDASDTVILFDFLSHFGEAERPPRCRRFVAVRPWDFGPYPPAWRGRINEQCDQLWVFCNWARTLEVDSGIRPDLAHVVPIGYDERIFTASGPRHRLPTDKRFRFLFVGGAVFRKGVDILLRAYTSEFTAKDDVCLVIHAHQEEPFYGEANQLEQVRAAAGSGGPEILLHREFLHVADLAGLYRNCNVGVFPYRAEGFAIPIVEGLATGLPPIVPRFGASLDYCTVENSFQIPTRRIALPVRDSFVINAFGFREHIDGVDFCEMEPAVLAAAMRRAYEMPRDELRRMSAAAAASVAAGFTERHMIAAAVHALRSLEKD